MSSCSVLRAPHCLRASEPLGNASATAPASARGAARILKGASLSARDPQRRQAHWRIKSSQQIQQRPGDGWRPGRELFGRAAELQWLEERLSGSRPRAIQVLVGPCNNGKTALLHEFQARNPNVVYIDCRDYDTRSLEQLMAELLARALQRAPSILQEWMVERLFKSVVLLGKINAAAAYSDAVKFQLSIGDLGGLLKSLGVGPERVGMAGLIYGEFRIKELLPKHRTDPWPVIIVDQANELMHWQEHHPRDVHNLLSFLILISKQARQCHVVLATSECGFIDWLYKEIGTGYWRSAVIGDFGEDQAREFLHWELSKRGVNCTLDDAAWAGVYQVCGGNAGNLVRLSAKLTLPVNATSLDRGLEAVSSAELNRVVDLANGGDGWTGAQFAAAALRLLDSPYHAVPTKEMEALLGQYADDARPDRNSRLRAGKDALRSLVAGKALAVRPYSGLAQDIPEEAFRVDGLPSQVVTAPGPVSLHCMGVVRAELEGKLAEWQKQRPFSLWFG